MITNPLLLWYLRIEVLFWFIIAFRWKWIKHPELGPWAPLKIWLGSFLWPYMVWGAVCSLTIDAVTLVFNLIWKIQERLER